MTTLNDLEIKAMKGEKELQEEMIRLRKLLNGDDPSEVGIK